MLIPFVKTLKLIVDEFVIYCRVCDKTKTNKNPLHFLLNTHTPELLNLNKNKKHNRIYKLYI